ncbi:peptide ABC transporter substrate-binding protein (plasmid) [Nicoliella spurrieriana]|uniref:Peptide ABC transporter substrate-binding protein n=1 Tax=Nicoliella spurrieriana TaxID=2925830 RepID=A0A976RR72_9LACO|nr:peptide ABC transporter substrate-binding protein [Nicoliella spurrieriana]UQS86136.1 peptide ABC transporter substrate-binding protein [Nicoliella spurrieriana]
MKKQLLETGAATLLVALGLAGCGSSSSQSSNGGDTAKNQTINWMQSANLITLDPSKCIDVNSATALGNVDQGLLKDPDGKGVVPAVAKSYSVSKDGKTYTFKLRHSKWSNGDPVTARDFVYGFQRTVNPKTASQDAYLYDHVENYAAIQSKKMAPTKLGVSAPNNYTLVVKLSKPQSYFKYLVTAPAFLPQNEKVVNKYGKKYGTNSASQVYNGPFKATGWTGTNDTWSLVKNDKYWDKSSVKLQRVNMHVVKDDQTGLNEFQTGKLDELSLNGKQQVEHFKNDPGYRENKTVYSNFIELNQDKVPAFKNLKIRKALSMAVNREQFVKDVLGDGSTPTKGFVGNDLAYHNGKDFADVAYVKSATEYNLAEAKKLWKAGMKELGLKSLNLTLTYDDTDSAKSTTEFLQSNFQKLPGLKVTNVNLPRQQRIARLFSGKFDMCVSGWDPSFPDPVAALSIKKSDSSLNFSKWKNSKFDAYLDKSENQDANNPDKRWNDLVQAEKVYANDQGNIPFYQNTAPVVMKTNIKGLSYNPSASTAWDFSKAYVK